MRLERFNFINFGSIFVVVTMLAIVFYITERNLTMRYLAERTNQNIFHLEVEIQKHLQAQQLNNIQAILDQANAIDPIIKRLSLSLDNQTIAISSSRSFSGSIIKDTYYNIDEMPQRLLHHDKLNFKTPIAYYNQQGQWSATLYIELHNSYVYDRLNRVAFFYGGIIFIVLSIGAIFILKIVRNHIVKPIELITQRVLEDNPIAQKHKIEELDKLDKTLCDTISTIKQQQFDLKKALDETIYLDNIIKTVAEVNQLLLTSKDIPMLLDSSCKRLVDGTNYEVCFIAIMQEELTIKAFSKRVDNLIYNEAKIIRDEHCPFILAMLDNKIVTFNINSDLPYTSSWLDFVKSEAFNLAITIPIISDVYTKPLGVMVLFSKYSHFASKEISMLDELSGDIGFAMKSFQNKEELRERIYRDTNTKLPNRVALFETLAKENTFFALAIINIDRFSEINEIYGIEFGDMVLSRYAIFLASKIDSFANMELYKLHGDEFVILSSKCEDYSLFVQTIKNILQETKSTIFNINDIEIILTARAGSSYLKQKALEYANMALKKTRTTNKDIEIFSQELKNNQINNMIWYKKIKEALENSNIVPFFQPIVSNKTKEIIKYEALVRLIDSDGSIVSPYLFLDIAKKTKLYIDITKVMIKKSIEAFRDKEILVSINLSTQDLTNRDLADYIEKIVLENNMGRFIEFEILESEGIDNYSSVMEFVQRFKNIGCRFAIDDFGSGYSNFEHLLKLNIDTLKIDASLIKSLPHNTSSKIFVKHISDFAHELNIFVVAEFVASEDIFKVVQSLDIDASQGYYFYEPSPIIKT